LSEALHTRWRLSVPEAAEEALCEWLDEGGATAYYREADPPRAFWAYFPPGVDTPDPAGLAQFPGVQLAESERFREEDWLAKSREGFGSFPVGRGFWVKPLWEAEAAPDGRTPVVVNPGLAFGTGGHETTRLCMTLLEELKDAGRLKGPLLDIGAGTGILALTAHLLGCPSPIQAFDIDPDCGPAMEELIEMNAAVLSGAQPFHGFVGTLESSEVEGPYEGLLANILLITIQELLPRMAALTAPGAYLVASGILATQEDEALISLAGAGFRPEKVLHEGDWIAILATRNAG
jgi:ribosomal protein L11 methyltransferase